VRIQNPAHCWGECKIVTPLWKIVWLLLKKLKLEYDTAIVLLGMYPKEFKTGT
jgi:hypothetical protein